MMHSRWVDSVFSICYLSISGIRISDYFFSHNSMPLAIFLLTPNRTVYYALRHEPNKWFSVNLLVLICFLLQIFYFCYDIFVFLLLITMIRFLFPSRWCYTISIIYTLSYHFPEMIILSCCFIWIVVFLLHHVELSFSQYSNISMQQ